ncbi:MAG: Lrp/AsnC family transcriptional regulator [Candidatus Bathyarchaeia archaeon]
MKPAKALVEIDIKILKALLKDARTSLGYISKECGISIPAITQRIRKMKRMGIITGTTLIANANLGQHSLSVDIKAEAKYEDAIIEAIKKLPNFISCLKVIGCHDIHAAIRIDSLDQIDKIKNFIKREKGVLKVEITTSIDELYFFPENLLKNTKREEK